MEIIQSAAMEVALWEVFAQSRGANATVFLGTVIAVWVAARFSSVAMDKGANTMAKLLCTAFAVAVFLFGLNLGGWVTGTYEGHAGALAALDAANGELPIGEGSQAFIDGMKEGGNMIGTLGAWLFYVSGLLIAVLPLWIKTND
jgi:hypothetical protein|tara:strand:+ start:206 stop:637 length:432 start_codon:yes stop_codon:yes gene_type:complete